MRKIIILLALLIPFNTSFVYGDEPIKSETVVQGPKSYKEVLELAKKEKKTILLFFSGERYCAPCRQMNKTFADPEVQKLLKDYIFYKIDVEGDEGKLSDEKEITSVPTYMIIDSDDKIIKRTVGYRNPKNFIEWLGQKTKTTFRISLLRRVT